MPLSARSRDRDGDHRWLVLVIAALAIVVYHPLSRWLAGEWTASTSYRRLPPLTWTAYEWRSGNEVSRAEGLYRRPGWEDTADTVVNQTSAPDPHLAVFTFQPVDLNRADAGVLRTIKGIGPRLAEAIVDYRARNGPFRRLDDLLLVKGIGPVKLAKLRRRLMVDDEVRND